MVQREDWFSTVAARGRKGRYPQVRRGGGAQATAAVGAGVTQEVEVPGPRFGLLGPYNCQAAIEGSLPQRRRREHEILSPAGVPPETH